MDKKLNRINTALVDNGKTNKWLAMQLGQDPARGRGIEKVGNGFKAAGLDEPQYEESCGGVITIIPRLSQMEGAVSGNDSENTQKSTQKRILEYLTLLPSLNRNDLSELIGVTPDTIKKHLATLQAKGLLRRVGGRKVGPLGSNNKDRR